MAFTHKPNRGSLFNARERKSDKSPDMTGTALINGVEMRVSGWWQESKGNKYLSLSFSDIEPKPQESQPATIQASDITNFEDEMPF